MKTNFLSQLFLVAFVSLSLYSCTADPVDDTTQKNNVIPKVSVPVAEVEINTVIEPVVPRPK